MSASPSAKIRVLVVESDLMLRTGLAKRLSKHPLVEVVGMARNSVTALPKLNSCSPDWIVVDICEDRDDGVQMLETLRDRGGKAFRAVIAERQDAASDMQLVRSLGVRKVLRRAYDEKSDGLIDALGKELLFGMLRSQRAAVRASVEPQVSAPAQRPARSASIVTPNGASCQVLEKRIVGIGVSTGGPTALKHLFARLPADFPVPIVVVQHMPPSFTRGLADSLDRVCPLDVREAQGGELLARGQILIAPGGSHMRVGKSSNGPVAVVTQDPPVCSCRPSVDYLFQSLVDTYGKRVLGVMLTGMGEDGWQGSRAIHSAGGRILAQDEESCTVFGMPRGPLEAGIATPVSLSSMAAVITQSLGGGK